VGSILQGVVSFMTSDELTTGGMKASDQDRKKFALASHAYNNQHYSHLFDGDIMGALEEADRARERAEQENVDAAASSSTTRPGRGRRIAGPRRKARPSASSKPSTSENENSDENNNDGEAEEDEDASESEGEGTKELNAAQQEAKKKKNAKKRAKQKAKKAAAAKAAVQEK